MKAAVHTARRRAVVMLEFLLAVTLLLVMTLFGYDIGTAKLAEMETERALRHAVVESVELRGVLDDETEQLFLERLDASFARHFVDDVALSYNNDGRNACVFSSDAVEAAASYSTGWFSRQLLRLGPAETTEVRVTNLCSNRGENL